MPTSAVLTRGAKCRMFTSAVLTRSAKCHVAASAILSKGTKCRAGTPHAPANSNRVVSAKDRASPPCVVFHAPGFYPFHMPELFISSSQYVVEIGGL